MQEIVPRPFYDQDRIQENWKASEFLVKFVDGDELWVGYSPDISSTEAFERFCDTSRYKALQMLLLSTKMLNRAIKMFNRASININEKYEHGVFINIRSYGGDWYDSLSLLPDKHSNHQLLCPM